MTSHVDPFLLREHINRAGMGLVWTAHQDALVHRTRVHLLEPDLAELPRLLQRVRHDAYRAADPNPSAVIDVDGGRPFVVMEHVEGATLAHLLRARRQMPAARALDIVHQLLDAVAALHDAGMIHADIQPASVVVEGGVISLVDFGGDGDASGASATEYLAPEVIAGGPPSVASDLYAVGVILFELLSGELPFKGASAIEIMQRQLRGNAPPLSLTRLGRAVPAALERVCARALAREPAKRFRDARTFAAALQQATAPEPAPRESAHAFRVEPLRDALVAAVAERNASVITERTLDLALALERHGMHHEAIDRIEDTLELFLWDERIAADDLEALTHRLRMALGRLHERAGDHGRARRATQR